MLKAGDHRRVSASSECASAAGAHTLWFSGCTVHSAFFFKCAVAYLYRRYPRPIENRHDSR